MSHTISRHWIFCGITLPYKRAAELQKGCRGGDSKGRGSRHIAPAQTTKPAQIHMFDNYKAPEKSRQRLSMYDLIRNSTLQIQGDGHFRTQIRKWSGMYETTCPWVLNAGHTTISYLLGISRTLSVHMRCFWLTNIDISIRCIRWWLHHRVNCQVCKRLVKRFTGLLFYRPLRSGDSVGHSVVDSVESFGYPHACALHVTARLSRSATNTPQPKLN